MIEELMQDPEPLVDLRDVSVQFGMQPVLRHINLKIPAGQTVALLGESGCGKTVLMKTIIGLVQPTSGQVLFDGQDINQLSERELSQLRLRFGLSFRMPLYLTA